MSYEEILREIIKIEILLEDVRLGVRNAGDSEIKNYEAHLRSLRDRLAGAPKEDYAH